MKPLIVHSNGSWGATLVDPSKPLPVFGPDSIVILSEQPWPVVAARVAEIAVDLPADRLELNVLSEESA